MSAPTRRRTRPCARAVVLLNREPNDLHEPHLHQAGICQRRHGNPALRGIDLSNAIITPGSATGTDVGVCGPPVGKKPERQTKQPRRGLTNRVRWVSPARTPPPRCPTGRTRSPRGRAYPAVRIRRRRWTTDIAQPPRDQAIELLAWMAQPSSPLPRGLITPPDAGPADPPHGGPPDS